MKNIVEMMIDGLPVRKISYQGKTYLPVSLGKKFSLQLRNNSGKRILAVISVDGVNVLDASEAKSDGDGYVIAPWRTIEVKGWRQSMEMVAEFEVTGQGGSYAAKTGRPNNVGVIGVAFYDEYQRPQVVKRGGPTPKWVDEREELTSGGIVLSDEQPRMMSCCDFEGSRTYDSTKTCQYRGGQSVSPAPIKAGTGYGNSVVSHVREVTFEKDYASKRVVVLYYDTVESLQAKGVPVEVDSPNPFPGEPERFFCPPPPR